MVWNIVKITKLWYKTWSEQMLLEKQYGQTLDARLPQNLHSVKKKKKKKNSICTEQQSRA